MTQHPAKALLFDLGRVLIPFEFNRAYRAMETLTGKKTREIRERLAATNLFREFETGSMGTEEFAAAVMKVLGFDATFRSSARSGTRSFCQRR